MNKIRRACEHGKTLVWLISAHIRFSKIEVSAPLHIVTGADHSHEVSLIRLLESIESFEPDSRITVWDLGLSDKKRSQIEERFAKVTLRRFDFDTYPTHVNISQDAGQYAWKPPIILETCSNADEILVWLDAGNLIQGELTWLRTMTNTLGFYSPYSSGNIQCWTHPKTLEYLGCTKSLLSHRNCNGAVISFRTSDGAAMKLLLKWTSCAMDPNCIAPEGSDRSNHRQDQAVLSVLSRQMNLGGDGFFRRLSKPLKILIHQDQINA